jgi:hypothetical protein
MKPPRKTLSQGAPRTLRGERHDTADGRHMPISNEARRTMSRAIAMTMGAGIFCVVCGASLSRTRAAGDVRRLRFDEVRSQRSPGREPRLRRMVLLAAFRAHGPRLSDYGRMGMGKRGARTPQGHIMIGPRTALPAHMSRKLKRRSPSPRLARRSGPTRSFHIRAAIAPIGPSLRARAKT